MTHSDASDANRSRKPTVVRLVIVWVALPLLFLLAGGSLLWWEAWIYCGVLLLPMTIFGIVMVRQDPGFLERRFKMREKERDQAKIQTWGSLPFVGVVVVPGLDFRFGWSEMPWPLAILGSILALAGYLFILRVFWVNRWAGRTVEVADGQEVITSGPYRFVRHPMYVGVILWLLATPLALGSFWGVIPALMVMPTLVLRIVNEEKVLVRELPGYDDYRRKVRFRLLPGVW